MFSAFYSFYISFPFLTSAFMLQKKKILVPNFIVSIIIFLRLKLTKQAPFKVYEYFSFRLKNGILSHDLFMGVLDGGQYKRQLT